MKNLNWKQIALGVLADIGSTIFFVVVLFIGFLAREAMAGRPAESLNEKIFETTPMLILVLVLGLAGLLLGAYVAAARSDSQHSAVVHACVTAVISTAILSSIYLVEPNTEPFWYNALSYGLISPTAIFGGFWRWRNLQRRNRVLDSPTTPIPPIPNS